MKRHVLTTIAFLLLLTQPFAQTGGPGQPEAMKFKPVTATNLVNLSTGTFSYNIPLFEIGGYPCNLSYQSGPQMDEVASIVGLGWNLNIGAITHNMRGLPDDFKGDKITRTIYMRPNITMGGNFNLGLEVTAFPFIKGNFGMGIFYNNYTGFGIERSYGLNFSVSNSDQTAAASLGLGMKANSQSGIDLYAQPSVSLSSSKNNSMSANGSLGGVVSVNSREGLKGSINASMSFSQNVNYRPAQMVDDGKGGTDKVAVDPDGKERTMSSNLATFSAAYSFSKSAEIPRVAYPYKTKSYSGSFKIGGEVYFLHPNLTLSGYYSKQEISTNVINTPAYGFLYSDQSFEAGSNVLLDYNREKDQPYVKDVSKNIGIPFYTNDIYSVNAQGISGSFQLNRNDIGVIADNRIVSAGTSLNIGLEVGLGNAAHIGADISTTSTSSSSGKWETSTTGNLAFKTAVAGNLYQSAYFKNASDVSIDVNNYYSLLKKDNALEVDLVKNGATSVDMNETLSDRNGSAVTLQTPAFKQERDPKTINIQHFTAAEAEKYGLNKKIYRYGVNTFECRDKGYIDSTTRTDAFRKPHHISEIIATNIDGMRYVFGLPTYNITQEEVSYTLVGNETIDAEGLIPFNANYTGWGTNGKDGFYEKTETPAYVTSNLLTAVLSPDYIDVDGNGPSMDDVGNYVKFNYTNAGVFTWRTPYDKEKATFNKAFLSDPTDNKGNYVSGTKELWFIHSIESKTEIAEFYYDTNRQDALGAVDQKKLYKLTSIKIYSKNERILKGASAVPIRIIRFSQDYELCPGTKNSAASTKGKLTLKQIGMYSGKSMRELQSPYKFTYGETPTGQIINPGFNPKNVNRWGNYQENGNPDIVKPEVSIYPSSLLSSADFPYASQDTASMNKASYAWNLTSIKLPSGGAIRVQYEPHAYSFTQDQRNMEMFLIEGLGPNINSVSGSQLYSSFSPFSSNNFLKIKLRTPLTQGDPYKQLLYQYFNVSSIPADGLPQYFYYKTLVQLRPDAGRESTWEWVSGYCKILSVGLIGSTHAYIELKPVCINDKSESNCPGIINPIAKNAFQFMRMNRQGLCYGHYESQPLSDNVTLDDFLHTDDLNSKVADQRIAFFDGFNKYAGERNFANNIALNKSFIRLHSPEMNKIIGGSRVRRIVTDDNWKTLTSGNGISLAENKTYAIDYEYTDSLQSPVSGVNVAISSGVTEYEPMVGGDENPLRQPSFYDQHIKMAPDNNLFVELPYNESLFPGVNLIYSKVKVIANKTNLNVPGTGYQMHEFFTAKDYPVKTDNTEIGDNWEKKTSMLAGLTMSALGFSKFHNYVTLSQGFSIVLNDMHGKARSNKNYNTQGSLISGETFGYSLNKDLLLARRDGSVYNSDQLGVSISAICDSRTTEHNTEMIGVDLNLDFTMLAIVPATLFIPLPKSTIETTRLNSVAFNKIINKKGIQTIRTVTENGASINTENVLFDEKTGNTLLTRTTNEFSDPIYSFRYPAPWIYNGLQAGYVSSGFEFQVSGSTVMISNPQVLAALNEGDELADAAGNRLWVTAKGINNLTVQSRFLGGALIPNKYKVIRPGKRNMITEEAGTIVTNYFPVSTGKISFTEGVGDTGVINASMKEYADNRVKFCNCEKEKDPRGNGAQKKLNPYTSGEKGNWYSLRSWAYLTGRTRSTNMSGNLTNVRKDGIFTTFSSFFNRPASLNAAWTINPNNWQWVEAVTLKDVNGLTLETKDALNKYSSMLTGYKQKLVVAEAGNAQQKEIMFDGFEDWNYIPYASRCDKTSLCQPEQINWNGVFTVAGDQSHTGKFSGKLVKPSTIVTVPLDTKNDCNHYTSVALPVTENDRMVARDRPTTLNSCCTGIFKPLKGKKYIISAWVRETGNDLAYAFTGPTITIGNTTFNATGNIIDGWQRIYGAFSVTTGGSNLNLIFGKGGFDAYFDDIRIYPADGKMITYVYDRNTQKLTFTCDENNYFTKYNYDGENNLQSVNRETEQGVQTIKENRSSTRKE